MMHKYNLLVSLTLSCNKHSKRLGYCDDCIVSYNIKTIKRIARYWKDWDHVQEVCHYDELKAIAIKNKIRLAITSGQVSCTIPSYMWLYDYLQPYDEKVDAVICLKILLKKLANLEAKRKLDWYTLCDAYICIANVGYDKHLELENYIKFALLRLQAEPSEWISAHSRLNRQTASARHYKFFHDGIETALHREPQVLKIFIQNSK